MPIARSGPKKANLNRTIGRSQYGGVLATSCLPCSAGVNPRNLKAIPHPEGRLYPIRRLPCSAGVSRFGRCHAPCGCRKLGRGRWPAAMGADAESACTESRTDSWSPDAARNPWSAPTTELWAPTGPEAQRSLPQAIEFCEAQEQLELVTAIGQRCHFYFRADGVKCVPDGLVPEIGQVWGPR